MPDILRHAVSAGETVKIPDVSFPEPELTMQASAAEPPAAEQPTLEQAPVVVEPIVPEAPAPLPEPPRLSREELKELCRPELDALCEEERQRAYAEALQRKKGELKEAVAEVEQKMGELEEQQRDYMTEYARQLKLLSVEVAEKFICQKIDENDLILQRLILNMVGRVKNANWLSVEVSDRLVSLIGSIKQELEKPEYHGRAEISPAGAPEDTVRVSTEAGTADASISVQARNLKRLFEQTNPES